MGKALRHCESGGLRSRCMLAALAGPRLVAPLQRWQFSLQRRQQRQSIAHVAASGALESTRTAVLMLPSPSSSTTVCTERRAPGGQPRVWACADGRWATRADRLHLDVLDLFVAQVMAVGREAILELRRGDEACAMAPQPLNLVPRASATAPRTRAEPGRRRVACAPSPSASMDRSRMPG